MEDSVEPREEPEYGEGGTADVFPRPRSLWVPPPTHSWRRPSASILHPASERERELGDQVLGKKI